MSYQPYSDEQPRQFILDHAGSDYFFTGRVSQVDRATVITGWNLCLTDVVADLGERQYAYAADHLFVLFRDAELPAVQVGDVIRFHARCRVYGHGEEEKGQVNYACKVGFPSADRRHGYYTVAQHLIRQMLRKRLSKAYARTLRYRLAFYAGLDCSKPRTALYEALKEFGRKD